MAKKISSRGKTTSKKPMVENTTIQVTKETKEKLNKVKHDFYLPSINEVIQHLIKNQKKVSKPKKK